MNIFRNEQTSVLCFSETGQRHLNEGSDCDDVFYTVENSDLRFFGLADGQSGKRLCRIGGLVVLKAIARYLSDKKLEALIQYEYMDEIQYELMRTIRQTLSALALEYDAEITDFSSTIVVMAIDPKTKRYLIVHLGDGAVIGVKKDTDTIVLSAPENGILQEYTWLTTSADALSHLRLWRGSTEVLDRVILSTDGVKMLWRGGYISKTAVSLLCDPEWPEAIMHAVRQSRPQDDASCIIVDLSK